MVFLQLCPELSKPQVEFFDPAKASRSADASAGLAALFGPAEAVAAAAAAAAMQELQQGASGELFRHGALLE